MSCLGCHLQQPLLVSGTMHRLPGVAVHRTVTLQCWQLHGAVLELLCEQQKASSAPAGYWLGGDAAPEAETCWCCCPGWLWEPQ